jgi:hypothetical protein
MKEEEGKEGREKKVPLLFLNFRRSSKLFEATGGESPQKVQFSHAYSQRYL